MSTIQFNSVNFRALFPVYANTTTYPDTLLQLLWNNATAFITNQTTCGWYNGMNINQQTLALNYMTAHLLALSVLAASGDTPGIVTGATIDKISVTIEPPPQTTQWQWWLNQTPYGAQLLALLQVCAAGVPTMHMDGETPDEQRQKIARAFARREIMNICSVDLMTFGYDLASASGIKTAVIESISDLRPTKSRPLQRQKNGRALRYKEQPAIILDHSCNAVYPDGTPNHGFPCTPVEWSLKGREKKKGSDERAIAVRQCSVCFFVSSPAPICKNCGHIFPIESRMVDQVDGELIELDRTKIVRRIEQGTAETVDDLIAVGRKRGMKNPEGWARHVFEARKAKQK